MNRTYPKVCERCRAGFDCGLSQCWCREFPVSDTEYERIVKQFHDCLCAACLSAITQHSSPPSSGHATTQS